MRKLIALLGMVLATQAFAHIEIGTYKGITANNESCSVVFKSITFDNNIKNPLNEKIEIAVGNETYVIGHAVKFNALNNQIDFAHDDLSGHKGTTTGAQFFSVHVNHGNDRRAEGPSSFFKSEHNWKTGQVTTFTCDHLEFIGR